MARTAGRWMRLAGVLAATGAAAAVSCGAPSADGPGGTVNPSVAGSGAPGTALAGTSWVLQSYRPGGAGAPVPAERGAWAALTFGAGDQLSGSTGCNRFQGTYRADGPALALSVGPMTRAACPGPALAAQESAVLALLPTVTGYRRAGGALALTGAGDGPLLTYTAGIAGLEGTSWHVTGVNTGTGGVQSSALTEQLTASFAAGGVFRGFGGCNELTGRWATTGADGLTVTDTGSTLRACTDAEATALEEAYGAALGRVATYVIDGDQLMLRDAGGATQVTARVGA